MNRRARPGRKGRAGAAQATRICALVRNPRSGSPAGRSPRRRPETHPLQPSCSDPPPRRLSCPRPSSLGSGASVGPWRRASARDRRRTSHFVEDIQRDTTYRNSQRPRAACVKPLIHKPKTPHAPRAFYLALRGAFFVEMPNCVIFSGDAASGPLRLLRRCGAGSARSFHRAIEQCRSPPAVLDASEAC